MLVGIGSGIAAYGSHNVAGEITYDFLGNNTVRIILTTYTDPSEANVDRCTADIEIWNSTGTVLVEKIEDIPRSNGPLNVDPQFPAVTCPGQAMGEYVQGTIKMNIYDTVVTVPGPGNYLFRYFDVARWNAVQNIPMSGDQAFFVETSALIAPIFGDQNSPRFLNMPLDQACIDRLWTHNPGGFDLDGDSLAYRLVPCFQYNPPQITTPIPCAGYVFPDAIGNNGPLTMDPVTGLITWDRPQQAGWYNIAYVVDEYRNGLLFNSLRRDMAIFVKPCDNEPPIIEAITDTCIYAGDTLRMEILAYDPDFSKVPPDSLYFYLNNGGIGNNGPFSVPVNPATLVITKPSPYPIPPDLPVETNDTVRALLEWATICDHIRPQFYQVDFYAHDNFTYLDLDGTTNTQQLSTHHIVTIRVIPRPTEGLVVTTSPGQIDLTWDPNPCDSISGYEIYRSVGGGYSQDTVCCETSPVQSGYQLIGTTNDRDSVSFTDDNNGMAFPFGEDICYVVRGVLADGSFTCSTDEECVQIEEDFAVLLQDSIDVTAASGRIYVSWSQPSAIDTAFFPGPYSYNLLRADDIVGPANYATIATAINFNDTTYFDSGMDTEVRGYRYQVDTYDRDGNLISEGNNGSSIFLSITPGDELLNLSWSEFVPWDNRIYYIYRADQFAGPFVLIDSVNGTGANTHIYQDTGLENFEDYCYVIVSEGEYGRPEVPDSVRNASQIACGIPQDLEPPCIFTSVFDTTKDCEALSLAISWTDPDSLCGGDVGFYSLYFAENREADFVLIDTTQSSNSFSLAGLNSIADCYGITATDTNGNESEMAVFCFENCPEIEIGNVFTPNNDGINDFFRPVTDRAVRIAEVFIYDRWGSVVYTSQSVDIDCIWDGRNLNGEDVPESVYYYLIRFEEDRLPNYVPKPPLTGHVNLVR